MNPNRSTKPNQIFDPAEEVESLAELTRTEGDIPIDPDQETEYNKMISEEFFLQDADRVLKEVI